MNRRMKICEMLDCVWLCVITLKICKRTECSHTKRFKFLVIDDLKGKEEYGRGQRIETTLINDLMIMKNQVEELTSTWHCNDCVFDWLS